MWPPKCYRLGLGNQRNPCSDSLLVLGTVTLFGFFLKEFLDLRLSKLSVTIHDLHLLFIMNKRYSKRSLAELSAYDVGHTSKH